MDKGIALRKIGQDVGVVDIVQRDAQMLEPTKRSPALGELPIDGRNDVSDIGVLKHLGPAKGVKAVRFLVRMCMTTSRFQDWPAQKGTYPSM